MPLTLTVLLVFSAVSAFTFIGLWLVRRQADPAGKRLRQFKNSTNSAQEPSILRADTRNNRKTVLEKILLYMGKLTRQKKKEIDSLDQQLLMAGVHHEYATNLFYGYKVIGASLFFLLYLNLGLFGDSSSFNTLFFAVLMAIIGYRLPNLVLKIKIRRRQSNVASALPDALDLLIICVEAGLGLNAAILRVGHDLHLRSHELSEEFILVNQDMRSGQSRKQALRNLILRNPGNDLRILVGSLILADTLGTSVGVTLRTQADSLRTRVQQRAQERAAKASINMLFPLVFLILPALFIVLLGPGMMQIYSVFDF